MNLRNFSIVVLLMVALTGNASNSTYSKQNISAQEFKNRVESLIEHPHFQPNKIPGIDVAFEWENLYIYPGDFSCPIKDSMLGIHTLANGFTFWGFFAGGDWEAPVYFIYYWDGNNIRGYVPRNGNLFNHRAMEAYGNHNNKNDAQNLFFLDALDIQALHGPNATIATIAYNPQQIIYEIMYLFR